MFMPRTLVSGGVRALLRNRRPLAGPGPGRDEAGRHVHDLVPAARNSLGEQPTIELKVRLNVPRLAKPTSHATSVTGRSVWRSSAIARSTRRRCR